MRSKKSSNSAPAPRVPVGISSVWRLVLSKPISPSVGTGPPRAGGGGASASAWLRTGYDFKKNESTFASQARLYGVNTV